MTSHMKIQNRMMDKDLEESLVNAVEVESQPEVFEELYKSINTAASDSKFKEEEKLRQTLKFFFMNPIEKWKYKKRFPYKFLVQLVKIIVVTLQSCIFAQQRSFFVDFFSENQIAFSHLFLQNWDPSQEIVSFPSQAESFAIYKISEFYSAIDFAYNSYANLDEAVGPYSYSGEKNEPEPMSLCFYQFQTCDIFSLNESYILNRNTTTVCINITIDKEISKNFSSELFLRNNNMKVEFSAIITAFLKFGMKVINLTPAGPKALPDCYLFNISIIFDNSAHDGKIKLKLDTTVDRWHCKGKVFYQNDNQLNSSLLTLLNSTVIVFCLISSVLCSRAIYRAHLLKRRTVAFFKKNYSKELHFKEKMRFVDLWYLTMISSDLIILMGSSLKEKIEENQFSGDQWNVCSVMLGVGTFLNWFCVLRYLGFFKNYNVVVLTLKVAAPIILRFMVCTMLIYAGFTFCGWLVLGPYHKKFRTLSITSECLFALINGDDVFQTFTTLEPTESVLIWWFCRIFLYFFVSLFIYVILSLFVSVIVDAYETIKVYYAEGFPKNFLQEFIENDFYRSSCATSSSSLANDFPHCSPKVFTRVVQNINRICCCRTSETVSNT